MKFDTVSLFDKQFKKLAKKYRNIKEDTTSFIQQFETAHQQATHIHSNLYKVRLANSDKQSGKRGGYRIYYYIKIDEVVYLMSIYDQSQIESINEDILLEYIQEIEDINKPTNS